MPRKRCCFRLKRLFEGPEENQRDAITYNFLELLRLLGLTAKPSRRRGEARLGTGSAPREGPM